MPVVELAALIYDKFTKCYTTVLIFNVFPFQSREWNVEFVSCEFLYFTAPYKISQEYMTQIMTNVYFDVKIIGKHLDLQNIS